MKSRIGCVAAALALLSACEPQGGFSIPQQQAFSAPTFSNFRVTPQTGRVGLNQEVTLAFTSSAELPEAALDAPANPLVTLDGHEMACAARGLNYTCALEISGGVDSDPAAHFVITGVDALGQSSGPVEVPDTIELDFTPPKISVSASTSTPVQGESITFTVTSEDEDLSSAEPPTIEAPQISVERIVCTGAARTFSCTATIPDDAVPGPATYRAEARDLAGNVAPSPTRSLTLREAKNGARAARLTFTSVSPNPAKPGDELTIKWDADQPVTCSALVLGNLPASCDPQPTNACVCKLRLPDTGLSDGDAKLEIIGTNAGGNASVVRGVQLDTTKPVVDAAKVKILRKAFGSADTVAALAGAFADAGNSYTNPAALKKGVREVQVFDSLTAAQPLFTVASGTGAPLQDDGSFVEVDVPKSDGKNGQFAPKRLFVVAVDAAGNPSARAEVLTGADVDAPTASATGLVIHRRDGQTQDGVDGSFSDASRVQVVAFDAASGGNVLGTREADPAGAFTEIAIGTTSSSLKQVWLQATDKCGNATARLEALVGKDADAPVLDLNRLKIVRKAKTDPDLLTASSGAVTDTSFTTVSVFTVATGGSPIATAAVSLTQGSFADVTLGTATDAFPRVWVEASDKCGNVGARTEVTTGADKGPPVLDLARFVLTRRDFTAADGVSAGAGAVADESYTEVRFWDAATGGNLLGSGAVSSTGALAEVAVGTKDAAPARVWVDAVDKCGNVATRAELTSGTLAAPVARDAKLSFIRRGAGAKDGVLGSAGAVTASCAARVSVWDALTGGNPAGTADLLPDGSFAEVPVGTTALAPSRLWVDVQDKCGQSAAARAEVLGRSDTTGPTVVAQNLAIVRKPVGASDLVTAQPATFSGPAEVVSVDLFDAAVGGNRVGSTTVQADGSLLDFAVGSATSSYPRLWVVATDKCGLSSTRIEIASGAASTPTLTAGGLTIVRRAVGSVDSVKAAPGTLSGACAFAAITATDPSGTRLGGGSANADGSFDVPVGTGSLAPSRVFVQAQDKCGGTTSNVEALAGAETIAPTGSGAQMSFVRRAVGSTDGVSGAAGSFAGACAVGAVSVYSAATGGTLLGTGVGAADGSFVEIAVGDANLAPPRAFVEETDKCGQQSPRVEVANGSETTAPVGKGALMTIVRKDLSLPDGVTGAAGAFTGACAPATVTVWDAATAGNTLGQGAGAAGGGFAEISIGTAALAPTRVWVEETDKCGLSAGRVEALVGAASGAPVGAGAKMTVVRRGLSALDGVVGAAGAFTGGCTPKVVTAWDAPTAGTRLGTSTGFGDGSFSEIPVGTTSLAPGHVYVEEVDKCGLVSARTEALTGAATAPTPVGSNVTIVRRPFNQTDGVSGAAGAVASACAPVTVTLFDASTSGATLGSGPVNAADGSFAEIAVGTTSLAPTRVFASVSDKCGQTGPRVEALVNAATTPPSLVGTKMTINRRGLSAQDGVQGVAGAAVSACHPGNLSLWDAPSAGTKLATTAANTDGSFAEVVIGTNLAAPAHVYVDGVDKCGRTYARVEAVNGAANTAPTAVGASLTVVRRDLSATDAVRGAAGSIVSQCTPVSVTLWDAATGGTQLGAGAVATDGSFTDIPVGTTSLAPARVFVAPLDKCGLSGGRVEALTGAASVAPSLNSTKLTINRRGLTAQDGVSGAVGAATSACHPGTLSLWDAPSLGTKLGAVVAALDGSFPELLIGSTTSAPARVYVDGTDKCGRTYARVEAANGAASGGPTAVGTSLTIVRRPVGQSDGVSGVAGAIASQCTPVTVTLFDASTGGTQLATGPIAANGSFAEIPVGSTTLAPARVFVSAVDKCGLTGTRYEALTGAAPNAPTLDGTKMTIARRDLTAQDGVSGTAAAAVSQCNPGTLKIWDAATGGATLGSASPAADGSFAEVLVGSNTSSPARVFVDGTDKCGRAYARVEAVNGAAITAPSLVGSKMTITRRALGTQDGVAGALGAVAVGKCPVASVTLFDAAAAGNTLGTGTVASDGSFAEIKVGSGTSAPARVFAAATDKCGLVSSRVEALNGSATSAPTATGTKLTITRRDLTTADGVSGAVGALAQGSCALASVQAFTASTGGTLLNQGAANADGSFAELAVGSASSAPAHVYVSPVDKCGQAGARVEALTGAATANPTLNGSLLTITRRTASGLDGVSGAAGAATSTCHPGAVSLWDSATGGSRLGGATVATNGSFAEVSVGSATSSPARVYVDGTDKCGLTYARVEALNGAATSAPTLAGGKLTITRRGFTAADGVSGAAGAASGFCAPVSVSAYDALSGGNLLGTGPVASDGSFAELAVGSASSAPARVYLAATDRCGLVGSRTEALNGAATTAPSLAGASMTIVRRDSTGTDGVRGAAGTVSSACFGGTLNFWDAATAGNKLGTGPASLDGSFAEVAVGTTASAPARVFVDGTDKCGRAYARVEALTGADTVAPTVSGSGVAIARRDFSSADGVSAAAGTVTSTCAPTTIALYDALTAGNLLATGTGAANGGFTEVLVGTSTLAPARVFVSVVDKCGLASTARVEALNGAASTAASLAGGKMVITRNGLGTPDNVSGQAGAVSSACYAGALSLWDASTGGTKLGTAAASFADGSFPAVLVGTGSASPARVWVDGADKCGRAFARTEALVGAATSGMAISGTLLTLNRRAPGVQDGVSGAAAALTSGCRPTQVTVWDAATGGSALGTGAANADGSFADVLVGTASLAPTRAWVSAVDKCGQTNATRVEALNGAATTAPSLTGSKLTIVRKGTTLADTVTGAAGAAASACHPGTLALWDAASGGTNLANTTAAADGSFAEIAVGTAALAPARVYVDGTDKCGRVYARTEALNGAASTSPSLDGTKMTLVRRDLTALDGLVGAAGAVKSVCSLASLSAWDNSTGGTKLGDLVAAADGSFAELAVGTTAAAPPQAWVEGLDKCGRLLVRTEAMNGREPLTAPPTVTDALTRVVRRAIGSSDGVLGQSNAISATCWRTTANAYDQSNGVKLGSAAVASDGSFPEIAIGTTTSAPATVQIEGVDKCGRVSAKVSVSSGRGSTGFADASKMTIVRNGAGTRDAVTGLANSFTSVCAPATAFLWLDLGTSVNQGTGPVATDASFASISYGTATSAPNVYVSAQDKCGLFTSRVLPANGTTTAVPSPDMTKIAFVRRDFTARDGVVGTAGAFTSFDKPIVTVNLFTAVNANTPTYSGTANADGSFAEIPIGPSVTSAEGDLWISGVDKAGQTSARTQISIGRIAAAPTLDITKVSIVRKALNLQDDVAGTAGAVTDTAPAIVEVYNNASFTAGTFIGSTPVVSGGAFTLTPAASPKSAWVQPRNKAFFTSAKVVNGEDVTPPTVDVTKIFTVRNDTTKADGLRASAGAVADPSYVHHIDVYDQNGVSLITFTPDANGGWSEVAATYLTGGAPDKTSAPKQHFLVVFDKPGNATSPRVAVTNGAALTPPVVDADKLFINRKPAGQYDTVSATAGAFSGSAFVRSVYLNCDSWTIPLYQPGGTQMPQQTPNADGSLTEFAFQGQSGGFSSCKTILFTATDKTGTQTTWVAAGNGVASSPPVIDPTKLFINRKGFGVPDTFSATAGAVVGVAATTFIGVACNASTPNPPPMAYRPGGSIYAASGVLPGTDGSIAETAFQASSSNTNPVDSCRTLYLQVTDKASNVSAWVPFGNGADFDPPVVDPAKLTLLINGDSANTLTVGTNLVGAAGAVRDPSGVNAFHVARDPTTFTAWSYPQVPPFTTGTPAADGSLPVVRFDTSPNSDVAWVRAYDKCGNYNAVATAQVSQVQATFSPLSSKTTIEFAATAWDPMVIAPRGGCIEPDPVTTSLDPGYALTTLGDASSLQLFKADNTGSGFACYDALTSSPSATLLSSTQGATDGGGMGYRLATGNGVGPGAALVKYGGLGANDGLYTYEFAPSSNTWSLPISSNAPPKQQFALAYNPLTNRQLLFGGSTGTVASNETYSYLSSSSGWRAEPAAAKPPARLEPAMVFDASRLKFVMFGGTDPSTGNPLADTWEYDGVTWTQRTVSGPAARTNAALGYDPIRRRVVLFGGKDGTGATLADTWEFDGSTWTSVSAATVPQAGHTFGGRLNHVLVYEKVRRTLLLLGGYTTGATCDGAAGGTLCTTAWEYDGAAWTEIAGVTTPGAQTRPGMGGDLPPSYASPTFLYAAGGASAGVSRIGFGNPTAGRHLWPVQVYSLALYPGIRTYSSMAVTFYGSGDAGALSSPGTPGARLFAWNGSAWQLVGANTNSAASGTPGVVSGALPVGTFATGPRLWLMALPNGPSLGTGSVNNANVARIMTDTIRVDVNYTK